MIIGHKSLELVQLLLVNHAVVEFENIVDMVIREQETIRSHKAYLEDLAAEIPELTMNIFFTQKLKLSK